jgi:hypothetical protein
MRPNRSSRSRCRTATRRRKNHDRAAFRRRPHRVRRGQRMPTARSSSTSGPVRIQAASQNRARCRDARTEKDPARAALADRRRQHSDSILAYVIGEAGATHAPKASVSPAVCDGALVPTVTQAAPDSRHAHGSVELLRGSILRCRSDPRSTRLREGTVINVAVPVPPRRVQPADGRRGQLRADPA